MQTEVPHNIDIEQNNKDLLENNPGVNVEMKTEVPPNIDIEQNSVNLLENNPGVNVEMKTEVPPNIDIEQNSVNLLENNAGVNVKMKTKVPNNIIENMEKNQEMTGINLMNVLVTDNLPGGYNEIITMCYGIYQKPIDENGQNTSNASVTTSPAPTLKLNASLLTSLAPKQESDKNCKDMQNSEKLTTQSENYWFCTKCDRRFGSQSTWNMHNNLTHYQCDLCGAVFSNRSLFRDHINYLHTSDDNTKHTKFKNTHISYNYGNNNTVHCDVCQLLVPSQSKLFQHLQNHTNVKQIFKCVGCKQYYGLKGTAVHHKICEQVRQIINNVQLAQVKCNACGQLFSRQDYLTVHRRSNCFKHVTCSGDLHKDVLWDNIDCDVENMTEVFPNNIEAESQDLLLNNAGVEVAIKTEVSPNNVEVDGEDLLLNNANIDVKIKTELSPNKIKQMEPEVVDVNLHNFIPKYEDNWYCKKCKKYFESETTWQDHNLSPFRCVGCKQYYGLKETAAHHNICEQVVQVKRRKTLTKVECCVCQERISKVDFLTVHRRSHCYRGVNI